MRGFQLEHWRSETRKEQRRAAIARGTTAGAFLALDEEDLLQLVGLDNVGSRGNVVKLVMLARGLKGIGIDEGQIPAALARTREELDRLAAIPLYDPERGGEAIDAAILEEMPETAEPRREVEPQI